MSSGGCQKMKLKLPHVHVSDTYMSCVDLTRRSRCTSSSSRRCHRAREPEKFRRDSLADASKAARSQLDALRRPGGMAVAWRAAGPVSGGPVCPEIHRKLLLLLLAFDDLCRFSSASGYPFFFSSRILLMTDQQELTQDG